jgi:hypothetical protein
VPCAAVSLQGPYHQAFTSRISVGQAKHREIKLKDAALPCVFCDGARVGTTEEHCPPRALFRDRAWPEGFVFPACESCNGGSSEEDLVVAFLAHMQPDQDAKTQARGFGLMRGLHKQQPGLFARMMQVSAVEARSAARRLKIKPERGQTYQELGVVNIPDEIHRAVGKFALKLSKAIYFQHRGSVFPADGTVLYQWFTNAQLQEHGRIPMLEAFANVAAETRPLTRGGKDLRDQFDYKFSTARDSPIHVLQVVFGQVFGFLSLLSQEPGRIENMHQRIADKMGSKGPFIFLTGSEVDSSGKVPGRVPQ